MISTILFITIFSILTILYVYIGYPILLFILTKIIPNKEIKKADFTPSVSMLISCYNEESVIEKKINNCLELDYPKEHIQFIFISDGSEDNTDSIIKTFTNNQIHLIRQEGRLGKTSGLNLGVSETDANIIVFSDANAMYDSQAIKKLVRNFNDEDVGYVVGAALYTDGEENAASQSESTYWKYELFMKTMESKLHSVVGGDGAIYAIRKSLFIRMDKEDINDFVNPLQIIAQGYRGVFEPNARCFEETAGNFAKEGKRKERIVNRSFNGLLKVKSVMNPLKTGFFSLEIISHKLLRWLIPVFFILAALGSILLSSQGIYAFHYITIGGVSFLWLALYGQTQAQKNIADIHPIFYYPYYFMLVNICSLLGIVAALQGKIQITWSTPRDDKETTQVSIQSKNYHLIFIILSAWVMISAFNQL